MAHVVQYALASASFLFAASQATAQFQTFSGDLQTQAAWRTAVGAPVPLEDFEHFRGVPTPFSGLSDLVTSLPNLGINLYGAVAGTYPGVYADGRYAHSGANQLANFGGGGANGSDYEIIPSCSPIRALGFWQCDPQGNVMLQAFAGDVLVGSITGHINDGTGNSFAAFISSTPITRVRVLGSEGDGWNHIDDLQVLVTGPTNGQCCGPSDFDGDGDVGTDADIEAFFGCLAGNCCPACFVNGADFNGDGDVGTDADIEAFFRVLAGGAC